MQGKQIDVAYLWKLVQEYEVLRKAQLFVFLKKMKEFSRNERYRIVKSLMEQIRIFPHEFDRKAYLSSRKLSNITSTQHKRIQCFWLLLDYMQSVDEHFSTGTYSRISMILNGKDYDILYVEAGEEKICLSHIEHNGKTDYIVVVEDNTQISNLTHPQIKAYATVTDIGEITYYSHS